MSRIRVLYVDDEPERVEPIVMYLAQDYDVAVEPNASKARKRCLKEPFDIIILDWEMVNQENGAQILEKIRQENAQIRVVVVTMKLYRVTDIAKIVNLGISKFHLKSEPDLLPTLKKEILEVVQNRDAVIQGLEDWLSVRKNMRNKVIHVAGGKSYTASQLLDELKKNSQIGRMQTQALARVLWNILLNERTNKRSKR